MIIGQFVLDVNEANAFIVGCEETGDAMLVDAAAFPKRMTEFIAANNLTLSKVLITHDHYDHTSGLADVMAQHKVTLYSGMSEVSGHSATRVGPGDTISVGKAEGRVIALPGHTKNQIGLVLPGVVFTGDALFAGSVGGTFSDSDQQRELEAIREEVFSLPDDTAIFTGHGPASTVAIEKTYNPFFV